MRLRQPSRPREIVASSKSASFLRRAPAGLSPPAGAFSWSGIFSFWKSASRRTVFVRLRQPCHTGVCGMEVRSPNSPPSRDEPLQGGGSPCGAFSCLCPDHKNLRIFDFLKGRFPGVLYLCAVMPPAPQIGNLHGGTMHGSDTRSGIFSRLFTGPPRSQDKSEQRWPVSVTALASPGRRLGSTLS